MKSGNLPRFCSKTKDNHHAALHPIRDDKFFQTREIVQLRTGGLTGPFKRQQRHPDQRQQRDQRNH